VLDKVWTKGLRLSRPAGSKRLGRVIALAAGLLCLLLSPAWAREKVSLQLRWDHQFQFAGYYAALWQGYYAAAGLEVEIRSALAPDGRVLSATDEVARGRADFGLGAADILTARDRGEPLVVLASIFQQSAVAFYASKETWLSSPADMIGLRVGRRANDLLDVEMQAMLRAEGIDPGLIRCQTIEPGMTALAEGRVDVSPGYTITSPYLLKRLGVEATSLRPAAYGIDFYGDSLFTSQALLDEDPELVQKFVAASLEGWRYALQNSEEIADRISAELPRQIRVDDLKAYNRFQIEGVRRLCLYPTVEVGHINPERWRRMHAVLKENGLIKGGLDAGRFIFDPHQRWHKMTESIERGLALGLAALLLAAVVFAFWVVTLRRAVDRRTRELTATAEERRRAEEALREAEEQYRLLFENSLDAVLLTIPDGGILKANQAACRLFDLSEDELRAGGRSLIVDATDPRLAKALEERSRHGGFRGALTFKRADGTRFQAEISSSVFRDRRGQEKTSMILRDLTEHLAAEKMRLVQRDLAMALNATTDLQTALVHSLAAALEVEGADCGGIYLVDPATGDLVLAHHQGVSAAFVDAYSHFEAQSPPARTLLTGKPIFHSDVENMLVLDGIRRAEGLLAVAVLPVEHEGQVIAHLAVASHTQADLPAASRQALETIAAQIGEAMARIRLTSELRESQRRLSTLMSNLPGMAYRCASDENWTMEFASEGCTALTGWHPADVTDNRLVAWASLVHPQDRELVRSQVLEALPKARPFKIEYRITTATGEEKWVWEQGRGVLSPKGEIEALEGFITDISERKRAEEALKQSEERHRTLIETMNDGLGVYDEDFRITYANDRLCEIFGRQREEVVGRLVTEFLDESNRQHMKEQLALRRKGRDAPYEIVWTRRDGGKAVTIVSPKPIFAPGGRFKGSFSVVTDISERRRAEEALRESEARYRLLVESAPLGVLTIDARGRITQANTKLLEILDSPSAEATRAINMFDFQPLVEAGVSQDFRRCLETGAPIIADRPYVSKSGKAVHLRYHLRPIPGAGGQVGGVQAIVEDYSDLKRAEEALKESEKKYRLIIENADEAILVVQNERIVFYNPRGPIVFGRPKADLARLDPRDLVHPQDSEEVMGRHRRRLKGGDVPQSYDVRIVDESGQTRWLWMTAVPTKWEGQAAVLYMLADITERKLAEEALKESESKFRALIENARESIVVIQDGVIQYANPINIEWTGLSLEELRSGPFLDFIHPDDREMVRAIHARRLSGEPVPEPYEFRLLAESGQARWVQASATFVDWKGGKAVLAFLYDTSERRRAEEALRESEQRYRETADNIPGLVYQLLQDKDGVSRFPFMSRRAFEIFGVQSEDIQKKARLAYERIHPDDLEKIRRAMKESASLLTRFNLELRLIKPGGELKWIHAQAAPHPVAAGGILWDGVLIDVTERKLAEERLKAALEEKEVLLREIHHRVKNNMQVISSLLKLQAETTGNRRVLEAFRESQDRVQAMALIHEALYQSETLAVVDLKEYALKLTTNLFQAYAPPNGRIAFKVELEALQLGMDHAIPLGLVLNELVVNSLKHAFPDGREGEIRITAHTVGEKEIELQVSDNGVGLPENKDWRHTKTLGLQLVIGLIEDQLGGGISLDRAEGARFTVRFKPKRYKERI